MSKPCEHQTLISNKVCKIKYCPDCDNIHLMLGAMTLHLTGKQFEQLAHSFRQAMLSKTEIDFPSKELNEDQQDGIVHFPRSSKEMTHN